MSMSIVVTSINPPTGCLTAFAEGAVTNGADVLVVGDRKSPANFNLSGARFVDVNEQMASFPAFAALVPLNSYTRKNIGYLLAMRAGAELILDTDDDNAPYPNFWERSQLTVPGRLVVRLGWVNAYRYFVDTSIWPRGFPLNEVQSRETSPAPGPPHTYDCPVQQGLADDNPDVDAVFRLLFPLPVKFNAALNIVLDKGAWCPFNSQNTKWWPAVFPLLYLPAYCSFRMTDIWRSFVVQRILWENGWRVSFHAASVYQQRNEHNLMRDFEDEVPGYLHNERIRQVLADLNLAAGTANHGENLRRCYGALVGLGVIGKAELPLLHAWIAETELIGVARPLS
jgi:hypothetical protein